MNFNYHNDIKDNIDSDFEFEPQELEFVQFSSIEDKFEEILDHLEGSAFIKFTWSAPKDACWILSHNSCVVHSFGEACLLLRTSDKVSHDLINPFEEKDMELNYDVNKIEHSIVLKRAYTMEPACEFRVFVKNRELLAISQRIMQQFKHLEDKDHQLFILDSIDKFLDEVIFPKFDVENFVIDLYVTPKNGRVVIVDINAWIETTDTLFFTWNELDSMEIQESLEDIPFRLCNQKHELQPAFNPSQMDPIEALAAEKGVGVTDFLKSFIEAQEHLDK
eukprot:TRINITY_DN3310_c0_g1_i1.p2 TRINITY_DN3310_c0_g1~~TRINITY_DN3310_c0_g1_i1.p2  ORF type:complete len:324 (+),score=109.83 TRINITY_DN3310_c0_g1_i1:142-972(+)